MTRKQLEARTKGQLVQIARRQGVRGWKEMTKADLVNSLISSPPRQAPSRSSSGPSNSLATRATSRVNHSRTSSPTRGSAQTPRKRTDGILDEARQIHVSANSSSRTPSSGGRGKGAKLAHTITAIQSAGKKDLVKFARERHIAGWHAMTKHELIDALTLQNSAANGSKSAKNGVGKHAGRSTNGAQAMPATRRNLPADAARAIGHGSSESITRTRTNNAREIANGRASSRGITPTKDRVVMMVRDPYWLHVYWELTTAAIQRTEAALGPDWFTAKPILRLWDVTAEDTTTSSESAIRDIPIHGGVNNWYIDVSDPPKSYRVDLGYLTARGRFFTLARSNTVTTPKPGVTDQIDEHWKSVRQDVEKIFSLSTGHDPNGGNVELRGFFEERLKRPMSSGTLGNFGSGALGNIRRKGFHFQIDAELVVYGKSESNAHITLAGEPIQLRDDGSFTLRFGLTDGRHILPVVASTHDGIEERTIILAVERNTKELEPMIHDGQE